MPLPFDPLLAGYLAAAGGPNALPSRPQPWPVRLFSRREQADYYMGQSGIFLETALAAVTHVVARTPLFTSHPEAGNDTSGAIPMRRRPGDVIEIHAGVLGVNAGLATALTLEIWGGELAAGAYRHWVREPVTLAAADAQIARYGIGRTLEAGPRFWFARLRFVDLVAVPATPMVQWFVSA